MTDYKNNSVLTLAALTNEQLLDEDAIYDIVETINGCRFDPDATPDFTPVELILSLRANSFYLPRFSFDNSGQAGVTAGKRFIPIKYSFNSLGDKVDKDGYLTATVTLQPESENLLHTLLLNCKVPAKVKGKSVTAKTIIDAINDGSFHEIVKPEPLSSIPDTTEPIAVKSVSIKDKFIELTLEDDRIVCVNRGCPEDIKRVVSINGYLYTVNRGGKPSQGISLTGYCTPLAPKGSTLEDLPAIGTVLKVVGCATSSNPANDYGDTNVLFVEDEEGSVRSVVTRDKLITTTVSRKLKSGDKFDVYLSEWVAPSGQRTNFYDVLSLSD